MIIKDSTDENLDTSMLDVEDIAQRTLNFLNSDIYVLIRQMMMEPLSEMLEKGRSVEEINNSQFRVEKEHVENAYKKIRPSLLVEEINEYKKWQ
jgi:SpoVK/Ycf46/Vps4 family AAA+-type ATPase